MKQLSSPLRRILFAHGAGAPSSSAWMRYWAQVLEPLGDVHAFDYPYARQGRRLPDRLDVLIEAHCAVLEEVFDSPGSVVLAGKSMGARVGCHVATRREVSGLVCFGYPLVGSGKTRPVRDAVLRELSTPILFVQGTRDRLCPLAHLDEVRGRMMAPTALHVVEGGDHSLQVGKRLLAQRGETQHDVDRRILAAVQTFLGEETGAQTAR